MTWKEAARRFWRRWRNVDHNYREQVREAQSWYRILMLEREHRDELARRVTVLRAALETIHEKSGLRSMRIAEEALEADERIVDERG